MVQQHVPAQSRHLELGGLWIWAESSSSQVLPSQAITVTIFSVFCSLFKYSCSWLREGGDEWLCKNYCRKKNQLWWKAPARLIQKLILSTSIYCALTAKTLRDVTIMVGNEFHEAVTNITHMRTWNKCAYDAGLFLSFWWKLLAWLNLSAVFLQNFTCCLHEVWANSSPEQKHCFDSTSALASFHTFHIENLKREVFSQKCLQMILKFGLGHIKYVFGMTLTLCWCHVKNVWFFSASSTRLVLALSSAQSCFQHKAI